MTQYNCCFCKAQENFTDDGEAEEEGWTRTEDETWLCKKCSGTTIEDEYDDDIDEDDECEDEQEEEGDYFSDDTF